MKSGDIYIKSRNLKSEDRQRDIHPFILIKKKGFIMTHKPPANSIKAIKVKQNNVYNMKLVKEYTYVTSENEDFISENTKKIGGVKRSFLSKLLKIFRYEIHD